MFASDTVLDLVAPELPTREDFTRAKYVVWNHPGLFPNDDMGKIAAHLRTLEAIIVDGCYPATAESIPTERELLALRIALCAQPGILSTHQAERLNRVFDNLQSRLYGMCHLAPRSPFI